MTKDLNKGISQIQYNSLNLPRIVDVKNQSAEGRNEYTYSAGGVKLKAVQRLNSGYSSNPLIGSTINTAALDITKTTDYAGNIIYEDGTLKRILVDGGYIENDVYYYYLTDHLGNNRIVANASGTVVQKTHYYPFGMPFADATGQDAQPYKYNNKELDTRNGLNWYDYSARYLFLDIPVLPMVDPHAENYYSWSPYAYVGNNPINAIDPTGMDYYMLTSDGHTVLALKTDDKFDRLYNSYMDSYGYTSISGKYTQVNDQSLLPQLVGGKDLSSAETSNSNDAFNVFIFAADNSSPEWNLKGYRTEGGSTGFLLSTSYDPDRVSSGHGSYSPSNLLFALHSHPDDPQAVGPSGSITKIPHTSDKYDIDGDMLSMYNRQIKSPTAKHYIYHEGTKKLIYYDWYTAIDKKMQNDRGRSKGVVNSGVQMRKKILGY